MLPAAGSVLEIASGSGEHALHLARHFPGLRFQPSDPDERARASIEAWRQSEGPPNLAAPLDLDVLAPGWWEGLPPASAILCINMIHIAPWPACQGLIEGAAALLVAGAPLYLYGPFERGGRHTAPSNEAFDASLRARDAAWGVRDLDEVEALAAAHGFGPAAVVEMPANNLSVTWRRGDGAPPALSGPGAA